MASVRAPYENLVGATAGAPCALCGHPTLDKGDASCAVHFEFLQPGDVLV